MKLLFIYPSLYPAYPIQLGALSAYLKRGEHETQLFAPILKNWRVPGYVFTELEREIRRFNPHFVAFCGYESAMAWIHQFCDYTKGHWPKIQTIVGGYYPSARPHDAITYPSIDIICRGEGEKPLLALLENPYNPFIPGLWVKDESGVPVANPSGPIEHDLDSLPWPDRFHNQQAIIHSDSGTVKVMAGWGCVYNCTYCQAKNMRALAPSLKAKDYVRLRSPDNVIGEILHLETCYKFRRVGFHDDIFWAGKIDWLRDFTYRWKANVRRPFYAAARVEMFNDEVMDLLHEAGCDLLLIGVESGDGAFRRKILKRYMCDDMIEWVVREARRRRIDVWTFNMVGMLDESYRSMLATARLNWRLKPDFAMCSVWYPLQGTAMGDEAHRRGLVDAKDTKRVTSYARETVLKYSWAKKRFLTLVRWLNILSACRRGLFWRLVWERIR